MTAAPAILHLESQAALAVGPRSMSAEEALGTVSSLVADLDPNDAAWVGAGPHVTMVVDAVRHALDGSGSPIAADEQVAPILRLRDLACTAHRAAGAPRTPVGSEGISRHLDALAAIVVR
ncbi:MAG: hypothetical protein WD638_07125 [Nitriliruptoraceae bacterium]